LLVGVAWPTQAAKWDIIPTVSMAATYSDNRSLAQDEQKKSDWVTQYNPGISVIATGPRLRFNANYSPEVTYYARAQNENRTYQRLDASGNAQLVKDLLFVDVGAKFDQTNISLQGPIAENNVNTTGNRATIKTFFASPYLVHDFGSSVHGEARFHYSVLNSNAPSGDSSSEASRSNFRLASGPRYKLLSWDVAYSNESINYENRENNKNEVLTASARRLITPTAGLLASVGYEKHEERAIAPSSEGATWSAGFDWTPTSRTRLSATTGERFYGRSHTFDFQHRTRLTKSTVGYSENVTNTRSEFFVPATTSTSGYLDALFVSGFPDPVDRKKAVEEFIAKTGLPPSLNAPVNILSSQLFLSKRWQASTAILGVRNVLIAHLFRESREASPNKVIFPGTGDFASSNAVSQTGTGFLWNWRMAAQTSWTLGVDYGVSGFPDLDRTDKLTLVRMGFNRQFQPRFSGSLNYRRQQNDSNQSESSYTETAVFATLNLKF
jgi:uncharacterized protein (PEP-CTERM system associated)